jgi:predicted DNA-binding transcriptional regulator AlpA
MASEIMYVRELAELLGLTEAGIRSALQRKSEHIPPSFKMGKRHAWRRATVTKWLEEREQLSARLRRKA